MLLDRSHRAWAIASAAILIVCVAIYIPYALTVPQGPRGGSPIGLFFGVLGFAFMLFAALLGARKRVPTWRLGRAQAWMRGHLWLGLLSLPLILLHSGFHFGGPLTQVLMWLLIFTVASGLYGALLQNYLPRIMTADVPLETIYAEISSVRQSLHAEATRAIDALCGPLGAAKHSQLDAQRAGGFTALRPISASAAPLRTSPSISAGASAAVAAAPELVRLTEEQSAPLRRFYFAELQPFFDHPKRRTRLADANRAHSAFAALETFLPPAAHPALEDLEAICDEARQLARQERLHHWLHAWLLVHIPISLALILLGGIHAVMALRY